MSAGDYEGIAGMVEALACRVLGLRLQKAEGQELLWIFAVKES